MTGHRHGGHGRGRHGRGQGMSGFFGGRGPRAGRGDIRAAILALLTEEPMHGYQIMNELAERTGGVWRPSPGSIYPSLQMLQDEGLVKSTDQDGRRVFELTELGTEAAAKASSDPAPWDAVAGEGDAEAVELRDLVTQVIGAARSVVHAGEPAHIEQAKEILRDARKRLYRILADDSTE